MRRLIIVSFILIALLLGACSQQDRFVNDGNYSLELFKPLYDSIENDADIAKLCMEFLENSDDIEIARQVQNYWMRLDRDSVENYAKTMSENYPDNTKYLYLYGRVIDNPLDQIDIGRKTIALDNSFPYGYRLVIAAYSQNLFNGHPKEEHYNQLANQLNEDAAHFTTAVSLASDDVYPLQALGQFQAYNGLYDEALVTLDQGKAMDKRWPTVRDYATVYAQKGDFKKAKALITDEYANIEDKTEKQQTIDNSYYSVLNNAKAYDELIRMTKDTKGYRKDKDALYNLACTYSLKGDQDNGIKALQDAAKVGWTEVAHTKRDTDLETLHEHVQWEGTISAIQANWDKGYDDRKNELLASKLEEEAPLWELPGTDGQLVKLADLKGKIVILDFWATWCPPCKMAMPVLDDFVKNRKPEDVEVFSVNIWDKGIDNPANFMKEHEYAMTLLYAPDELSKEYQFNGIPHICVIDKEGKIRYRHAGFSDALGESLDLWVEDLQ